MNLISDDFSNKFVSSNNSFLVTKSRLVKEDLYSSAAAKFVITSI